MKKLTSIPAYLWAVFCMLLIPVTFIGNNYFSHKFATLPFMKINPIYAGGEVSWAYTVDSMEVTINKPVFESLIGSSSEGFVQIKFSSKKQLPEIISAPIDYNNDGKADFKVTINTLTTDTKLNLLSDKVTGLDVSSKVKDYWIVRVKLLNPEKN